MILLVGYGRHIAEEVTMPLSAMVMVAVIVSTKRKACLSRLHKLLPLFSTVQSSSI